MTGIVVLSDVIVPNSVIAAGVRGRQIRKNSRTSQQGGFATANVIWTTTLRQYELGTAPMTIDQWQAIEGLQEVTDSGAYGMLMKDPKDSIASLAQGKLYPYTTDLVGAIGVGYGVPVYKLYKRYTSVGSTRTKDRKITRPILGAALKRGGIAVTLGASASNAAIDYDTGTVTFFADSSSAVTAMTAGATTQITLTAALAGLAIGERLYLSGLTGTAASTLNGASHVISDITGGGLNVYHLTVNTTGLSWTSGGSGYDYPQASETLTWSGSFYVPVQFAEDFIDWEMVRSGQEDSRLLSGPSVPLIEVRE